MIYKILIILQTKIVYWQQNYSISHLDNRAIYRAVWRIYLNIIRLVNTMKLLCNSNSNKLEILKFLIQKTFLNFYNRSKLMHSKILSRCLKIIKDREKSKKHTKSSTLKTWQVPNVLWMNSKLEKHMKMVKREQINRLVIVIYD